MERIATAKRPVLAITELIWNALDADATLVDIDVQRNHVGGIDVIRVRDNGHGIRTGARRAQAPARCAGATASVRPAAGDPLQVVLLGHRPRRRDRAALACGAARSGSAT